MQRYVTVQLVARGNAWQDSTPVEVISGEVRIGKELNWFQGILREYFYSCYVMGTLSIFVFQALCWTVLGRYVELNRERIRREVEEWEQEHMMHPDVDHGVHWEAVPGEDDDEWNDLPTEGQQEADRPVTPEHHSDNDDDEQVGDSSSNAAQSSTEEAWTGAATASQEASSEDVRAARVMRGQTEPYEVFTGECSSAPIRRLMRSPLLLPFLTHKRILLRSLDHDDPDLIS